MKTLLTAALTAFVATASAASISSARPSGDPKLEKLTNDLDRDDLGGNLEAAFGLHQYLTERKEVARKTNSANGITDDPQVWGEVVRHLVNRARLLEGRDTEPKALKVRERIIDILSANANDPLGREYLMHVLENGPNSLRMTIIWGMRSKNGLHGDDATRMVKRLSDTGAIPEKLRGMALASAGEGNLDAALNYLATTQDKMGFINAAMAYQMRYHSSEHFDLLLRRVKELRLDRPVGKYRDGIFWIDPKLLAQFVDKASGEDLKNALEVMGFNSGLISVETRDLQPLIKCLSSESSSVRQLAAKRLSELDSVRVDQDLIVSSIASAREKESDPPTMEVMKKALSTAIDRRDRNSGEREKWSHRQGAPR